MIEKRPSFQFYPGDWMKDPGLRRCSKQAKGVWIDMICLMFECEERGVLISGGKPWSDEDIAVAVGGDIAENLKCIAELLEKGVAFRNNSGAIFSRRLVRDEQKRQLCSKAGKAGGGNPNLTFKGQAKGYAKENTKASFSSSASTAEEKTPHKSPLEIAKESERTRAAWFEEIWAQYPNKDGRKAAERHFLASVETQEDFEKVKRALAIYKASKNVKNGYVKNGSTWFNNWRDWITDPTGTAPVVQLMKCPVPGCTEKPMIQAVYLAHRPKCEERFKTENSRPLPAHIRAEIDRLKNPHSPQVSRHGGPSGDGLTARGGAVGPSAIPTPPPPRIAKEEAPGAQSQNRGGDA